MINYNGSIFLDNEPILNAANRSFKYGDGLFETMRAVNGKVPLFGFHFDRLLRGMKALKINTPAYFNVHYLKNEVSKTLDKMPSARVRLTVWRESGGGYTPTNFNPDFLIESISLPDKTFTINDLGLAMGIYSDFRLRQTPVSAFKTANALPYILAGIYARENSFDDVFLLDTEGSLAEAISSNFFILKDKKLLTPPLSVGCVGGVMRLFTCQLAQKMGVEIEEKTLTINDVESADEVFLTNALQGFKWVEKLNNSEFKNDFINELNALFLKELIDLK
jgi:branched-chain amino acid aminotransferase